VRLFLFPFDSVARNADGLSVPYRGQNFYTGSFREFLRKTGISVLYKCTPRSVLFSRSMMNKVDDNVEAGTRREAERSTYIVGNKKAAVWPLISP